MLDILIHLVLMVLMPPLLFGVINRTKASFAGRTGPPPREIGGWLQKARTKNRMRPS